MTSAHEKKVEDNKCGDRAPELHLNIHPSKSTRLRLTSTTYFSARLIKSAFVCVTSSVHVSFSTQTTHSLYLYISHTHTHRDAGSRGGVTHSQDGDVLGPIQPPDRCPGLADPLHHGHIMLPVKNIIISRVISSSVITVEDYHYAVEVEEMQIDFVFKAE